MTDGPILHPARTMPFADLVAGLEQAKADGLIYEALNVDGLRLFCYTKRAVYERKWTPFSIMARGLIIDESQIVATPFPKFFNLGEAGQTIPDLPFEVFEKVDGSLIIIFWYKGKWRTATKGSLVSDQARWAQERVDASNTQFLQKGVTYLAEAIYPENRIVIRYDESALVLLGAYDLNGSEIDYYEILQVAASLFWSIADRYNYRSISDLIAKAGTLPATEEGFVVRFLNGLRLKIKGDEYKRIHAMVSRVTPLAVWEAMAAGSSLKQMRADLPEEFWADFDAISGILNDKINQLLSAVAQIADELWDLTDKDVGLMLPNFPKEIQPFIFPYRKQSTSLLAGRSREPLFRAIRPTGNNLGGYTPSYAMKRVLEDIA